MTEKYDALADRLGAERSARARYQKAYEAQQKRIRELEAALKKVYAAGRDGIEYVAAANYPERERAAIAKLEKVYDAAILKGAK